MSASVPNIDRERLIDIVTDLVSIPSVSGDELAIMQHVAGFFEGAGAKRMMLAALEYLRDADAVILDLRGHGGGSGDMSNWLLSHFLAGDSLLTLRATRDGARGTGE